MPEKRLARTRATLPDGYKFGDAHASHPAFDGLSRERALALVRSLRDEKPLTPYEKYRDWAEDEDVLWKQQ